MTTAIKTLILAAISGFANGLPLSGEAHTILFKEMMGLQNLDPGFYTAIYGGCALAALVYFAKDAIKILQESTVFLRYPFLANKKNIFCDYPHALIFSLLLLTLLANWMFSFILGSFSDLAAHSFSVVGMASLVSGYFLIKSRKMDAGFRTIYESNHQDSFVNGLAMGVSSIPGISRIAAPLLASMQLGMQAPEAARLAFLLTIPIFVTQAVIPFRSAYRLLLSQPIIFFAAFFTTLVTAYVAINVGMRVIRNGKLFLFGIYTFIFGIVMLFLSVPRILDFWGFR